MRTPLLVALLVASPAAAQDKALPPEPWEKAVAEAAAKPPMTPDQARVFISWLTDRVEAKHLKAAPWSPQQGMLYEYSDVRRRADDPARWVQGEALDTMHDGAWFAVAMANAARATGDKRYRAFLVKWQLPFYTKMLNESDTLFDTKLVHVAEKGVRFNLEHALQPGEKGFCPYWWDDEASVSLERRRLKDPMAKPPFACTDRLAGKPNPQALLSGYSHGSSNHLAQDLGPMLMLGWLLLRESADPAEKQLAADCARAAKYLQECRTRHGAAGIPAVVGPAALTNHDAELMKRLGGDPKLAAPNNHYTRFLTSLANPEQRQSTPGFADDMQYTYYAQLARTGGKPTDAALFRLIYDCYTEPMLFRYWSDTAAVPPGLNRFDLIGHTGKGGKFESYRSDRPVPIGSRFGPQNMAVCGWALQALDAKPGLWDKAVAGLAGKDVVVPVLDDDAKPGAGVAFEFGRVAVKLAARRDALLVQVTERENRGVVALSVRHADADPDKGPGASILAGLQEVKVHCPDGRPLTVKATTDAIEGGGGFVAGMVIPYAVVKSQTGRWMNGVELGRYSIRVGKETRNFVLASSEKQVRAAIERELSGGLRTWQAIFDAKGYIPTGIGAGGDWDYFSDTGGYAHLISAASQYILWREGKRDWDVHQVPAVK